MVGLDECKSDSRYGMFVAMLEAVGLGKSFGPTVALHALDLKIGPGEIVAVIGENGAGKSTLMNLLAGVHTPTNGEVRLDGVAMAFKNPRAALDAGIAIVHQELNLIPTLSAEDNLFLGRELCARGAIDRTQTRREAVSLLERVGAKYAADAMVEDLTIAQRQLIEIAKALSVKARYVIFDEPTAVLSEIESERLFALIRELKSQGVGVLYVSHRLPEILTLVDRIVVLRDGEFVAEADPKQVDEGELAELMVGRPVNDLYPPKPERRTEVAIEIKRARAEFSVRRGEIVGLAGLIGSGRTELCEEIVGLRRGEVEVTIDGKRQGIRDYRDAIAHGLAYVSEDRKGRGVHLTMSIADNLNLAVLDRISDRVAESRRWVDAFGIKTENPENPVSSLSGGNQQKVSMAKWTATNPKVLFLDEPTRGVDVGAKAEIYRLIAQMAADGMACVVVSSELPELIGLCHRLLVMRENEIVGELAGDAMTESAIMRLAAGVAA